MTASNVIDFQDYQRSTRIWNPAQDWEHPLMIDWLTIRQMHPQGNLPLVTDGRIISVLYADDAETIEYEVAKRSEIEGSFDSRMYLRCDGNNVEFHGNVARFSRPDNVFGYDWPETIRRLNLMVAVYGLPPFTAGQRLRFADSGWQYTGARVSRIDITCNYFTGSERDAQAIIHKLGSVHVGRQKGSVTPDGTTVLFGYGSQYASGKVYLKHHELTVHKRKKSGQHVAQEVIDFCRDQGVLREEHTLKSRFLTQQGLCWLAEITQDELMRIFQARSQVKGLTGMGYSDTSALTPVARGLLASWQAGEPLSTKKTSFYKYRREILNKMGIDIGVTSNVVKFQTPIRTVEIQKLVAPDWYRAKYG